MYQYPIDGPQWITADKVHDGSQFLEDKVYIQVDQLGTIVQITSQKPESDIQAYAGWIVPAWVNAHCHLELSHMLDRIPRHTGLPGFLSEVVRNRNVVSQEEKQSMILAALQRSIDDGIVAFGDICNTKDTIELKQSNRIYFHSFIEAIGRVPERAAQSFDIAESVYHEFKNINDELHYSSIVPHAPYSLSDELMEMIDKFDLASRISIHSQESASETELFEQGTGDFLTFYEQIGIPLDLVQATGYNSLQWTLQHLQPSHPLLLVHNTFMTEEDVSAIKKRKGETYLCLCPKANLYIEGALPSVDLMVAQNLNICLGTDSLASNDQLSIWSEITTIKEHFPSLTYEQLIQWGSQGGAQALGIEDRYGSLRIGTSPGLVWIDEHLSRSQRIV